MHRFYLGTCVFFSLNEGQCLCFWHAVDDRFLVTPSTLNAVNSLRVRMLMQAACAAVSIMQQGIRPLWLPGPLMWGQPLHLGPLAVAFLRRMAAGTLSCNGLGGFTFLSSLLGLVFGPATSWGLGGSWQSESVQECVMRLPGGGGPRATGGFCHGRGCHSQGMPRER